jgi:hypothetical protein
VIIQTGFKLLVSSFRRTQIVCPDNFQTIFHDFCTVFVCVSEIKNKLNLDCIQKQKR